MKYEDVEIKKNEEYFQLINTGVTENVIQGLLGLALYGDEFRLIQDTLVRFSNSENENIRGIAILCFGHLARIHGKIDKRLVLPIVNKGLEDNSSFVQGHSNSALDDINFFVK
ncbi:hypothetical protein [Neobacillus sp.]|uniref:hypothetical protein n=1 Tax=Neobacillus sp. TaxID=2675273 RepID=UPI002897D085|nr:hypothetical protein [Neobacillus sp.]